LSVTTITSDIEGGDRDDQQQSVASWSCRPTSNTPATVNSRNRGAGVQAEPAESLAGEKRRAHGAALGLQFQRLRDSHAKKVILADQRKVSADWGAQGGSIWA